MSFSIDILSAIAILVMAAVIAFMDWIPTPLNRNIQGMATRERLPGSIIHSTLGVVFAMANILVWEWIILVGAVWYSIVLFAAIRNWWVAYFAGVHQGEITPEIYSQHYAQNIRVLPRFKDHPIIPDIQHMLIHLSVLIAVLLSWWSFWLA